ncbi:MAG: hypothetical protein Q4A64_03780 [Porphyromonadaceae bacterium]|nr:hypothetical protein [Porphyromonadaceae bacterium]
MGIKCIHVFCLILILAAILIGIWIIKCYNNKRRSEELQYEEKLAQLRLGTTSLNVQLSDLKDVIQSLVKSNEEIIKAWIGREKIEKEQEDSGSKPKK